MIHFTKMHGCGNDYIYVDTSLYSIADPEGAARAWSSRHTGIGSDGLVLIGPSPSPDADFSMRIFNADGSEAMMCGNACRCVGKYLYEKHLTSETRIRLLTRSGVKTLQLHLAVQEDMRTDDRQRVERVTVDMGEPLFADDSLFVPAEKTLPEGTFVSMGNPHYVIFVDDVEGVDVAVEGARLECHPAFPKRCNIEFAEVRPGGIRVRVWERGSGITQACGTGACATAVATVRTGRTSGRQPLRIVMDGGMLDVEWNADDNHVYKTGTAEFVFEGDIALEERLAASALVNEHFLQLQGGYLFADIARRVAEFRRSLPTDDIISLGIGDVTRPLCPAVVEAIHRAADEMANGASFRGYGPEQGYAFLREAIVKHDFLPRGIQIDTDEIFVSDGAKSDTGNIQELLSQECTVGVTDPVYPVYVDSNVMAGRAGRANAAGQWSNVVYMPCRKENAFVPQFPDRRADVIYLCYPNNPTGTTLTRGELKKWVDYALSHRALIFFDAAYEAYIQEPDVPHSIYEIPGASRCAIEFHSYSKTAGFTGVRCGYTVVPKAVTAQTRDGRNIQLNALWNRRQCTKFNGASYISQRAAEAIYTPEGRRQVKATIDYYMGNAGMMRAALSALGLEVYGGVNAPYLWVKTPDGKKSWQFFDELLRVAHVVCTPGVGFGPSGEGFVRLTAFGRREDTLTALERIKRMY